MNDNKNNPIIPSIFEYNDFRNFLKDYQKAKYCVDKGFSKSNLCRMMGLINSRSYFNDVMNGKKVTATFIDRFISVLEMDDEEAQFFRVLVKFNQADEPEERELYFSQLISLNRTPKKILDPKVYEFYSEWYHSVIRSILDIYDFDGNDYPALVRIIIPTIKVKQAKKSIQLLTFLNLIKINEKGFYKPTDKAITTNDYVKDELIKQYQAQCLDMAKKTLMTKVNQPHEISTNIISISGVGFERLQERLRQFKSEIRSLVHKDENPADRVYQLNIQLFPNSKIKNNKNNEEKTI